MRTDLVADAGLEIRKRVSHELKGLRGSMGLIAARITVVRYWQILLQKSQKAQRLISRQRTKQAKIADQ
jgi:hypothetical protein